MIYRGSTRGQLIYRGSIRGQLIYRGSIRGQLIYRGSIRDQLKWTQTLEFHNNVIMLNVDEYHYQLVIIQFDNRNTC